MPRKKIGKGEPKPLAQSDETLAAMNDARRWAKLPLLVKKIRDCLFCKRPFESIGARTCGCSQSKNAFDLIGD